MRFLISQKFFNVFIFCSWAGSLALSFSFMQQREGGYLQHLEQLQEHDLRKNELIDKVLEKIKNLESKLIREEKARVALELGMKTQTQTETSQELLKMVLNNHQDLYLLLKVYIQKSLQNPDESWDWILGLSFWSVEDKIELKKIFSQQSRWTELKQKIEQKKLALSPKTDSALWEHFGIVISFDQKESKILDLLSDAIEEKDLTTACSLKNEVTDSDVMELLTILCPSESFLKIYQKHHS